MISQNPGPDVKGENSPWPIIRLHGETLVRHDTEIKGIVTGMEDAKIENREAHKLIYDAVNSLRKEK